MPRKPMTDAEWEAFVEQEVRDNGQTVEFDMEYEEFLEVTGLDDSFVGSRELGVPGTYDIFEAAMRIVKKNEETAAPAL